MDLNKELERYTLLNRERWTNDIVVPLNFQGKYFDKFDKSLQPAAFEAVSTYQQGKSLTLFSPEGVYGVGKTHLVYALVDWLIREGKAVEYEEINSRIIPLPCPVQFVSETRLLARIRDTFNPRYGDSETEEQVYRYYAKYPLLIIDDVGKVKPRDIAFLQQVYYRIIDDRYSQMQDIIITTNLNLKELENHIGGACADRLREMCGKRGFIKMTGKSYRKG